jgi:hypothetical protein
MITVYGASDDCIEVDGCEGADEFSAPGGRWHGDLVAPGGTEQLRIYAEYGRADSECWVIALLPTDEDVPFPDWGNGAGRSENGYSCELRIDAPEGTRLTNVYPGRQED